MQLSLLILLLLLSLLLLLLLLLVVVVVVVVVVVLQFRHIYLCHKVTETFLENDSECMIAPCKV